MGKWIYYVEDDTSIRELVLYALKTAEFQVMGFENAASFYKRMKEQQPDLILLAFINSYTSFAVTCLLIS